jgi:hypothetical protein
MANRRRLTAKSSTKVTFDHPGTYTLRAYALDPDAYFSTQDVVVTVTNP